MTEPAITNTTSTSSSGGCNECYLYGVLLALLGSTLEALGLSLWKLHHIRKEKAERERMTEKKESLKRLQNSGEQATNAMTTHPATSEIEDHDLAAEPAHSYTPSHSVNSENGDERQDEVSNGSKDPKNVSPASGHDFVKNEIAEIHASSGPLEDSAHVEEIPRLSGTWPCCCCPASLLQEVPWTWLLGFCIFAIGNLFDFLALGISKQSVVTLVGSWALVVNTLTAKFILREHTSKKDYMSSLIIICGILLTVFGSEKNQIDWSIEILVNQYKKTNVKVMLCILASLIGACFIIMRMDYVKRRNEARSKNEAIERPSTRIGAVYCIVASFVADFTVLFGKAFSGLIIPSITGSNQFTDPFVAVIIVVFCISLPSQLFLINKSLSVNDALYHIPNFYVFWNVGSIITGAIFYEEMVNFSVQNWVMFILGVLILFVGVIFTNLSAKEKAEEETRKAAYLAEMQRDLVPVPEGDVQNSSDAVKESIADLQEGPSTSISLPEEEIFNRQSAGGTPMSISIQVEPHDRAKGGDRDSTSSEASGIRSWKLTPKLTPSSGSTSPAVGPAEMRMAVAGLQEGGDRKLNQWQPPQEALEASLATPSDEVSPDPSEVEEGRNVQVEEELVGPRGAGVRQVVQGESEIVREEGGHSPVMDPSDVTLDIEQDGNDRSRPDVQLHEPISGLQVDVSDSLTPLSSGGFTVRDLSPQGSFASPVPLLRLPSEEPKTVLQQPSPFARKIHFFNGNSPQARQARRGYLE
ncbi:hypothetical protein GUITHDRAFT_160462 [Guillardia theta CCMP2712]|uniref:Uncharacterized protein n=2 Tax=Guillardia theta TaxID=55529 RepID=L1K501_GUITC|nr:hypothetical protein GUITHDRAFT_160462 [Guillardia theta CCMP2712]EKX55433.1 hypothetical protein GUITHDRAFT_160462 [Guillardia theta CCMP2712]|mmetsp:Transcript_43924/g.138663  ORF Transcript_43924/g.138663 Transcript_43924/m.138663 type:complete len:753 (+) Transcript_43924:250-2508(+)|eukprot:XP_005842413.1 hypothetical protein GUITHDRAFT_160462 [Guillardia theta CCMP2712]